MVVVITPPPFAETTNLWAQVVYTPLNEPVETLANAGPIHATVAATASWSQNFTVPIQSAGSFVGGGGYFYLEVQAIWFGAATMTVTGAITGSYGCPGSMKSMSVGLTPTTNASGSMSVQTATIAFGGVACPDGSAPTANFTASATLSPG
ncbi:MAG: hypothetical protein ACYDHB_04430 [Candidatus Dormibacteria bacterium]